MSSLNLKFDISNKQDASLAIGALIVLLSVYLNVSTNNTNNIISIPVTCLVIILSSMFGAIQVSIQNVTYNTCDCKENDIYDDSDDETESGDEVAEDTNNEYDCSSCQCVSTSYKRSVSPADSVSTIVGQVAPSRSLEQLREFATQINENNRKKRAQWEMDLSGADRIIFNPEEYLVTPLSVDTDESSS